MIWKTESCSVPMTTEAQQLLDLLKAISSAKPLTQQHKSALLSALRHSPEDVKCAAWEALAPWQCERLWEVARSGR
jgi:hypothetical protein